MVIIVAIVCLDLFANLPMFCCHQCKTKAARLSHLKPLQLCWSAFVVASQGYWPDGIYTAPTDAALKHDIEVSKQMGFNMLRKHIKVEPDRCTTLPSFSCSSAFCCCCLILFRPSSLHTSSWSLTNTKQQCLPSLPLLLSAAVAWRRPAPLLCTPQGGAWPTQSKTCHLAVLFIFVDRTLSTKAASRLTPVTPPCSSSSSISLSAAVSSWRYAFDRKINKGFLLSNSVYNIYVHTHIYIRKTCFTQPKTSPQRRYMFLLSPDISEFRLPV